MERAGTYITVVGPFKLGWLGGFWLLSVWMFFSPPSAFSTGSVLWGIGSELPHHQPPVHNDSTETYWTPHQLLKTIVTNCGTRHCISMHVIAFAAETDYPEHNIEKETEKQEFQTPAQLSELKGMFDGWTGSKLKKWGNLGWYGFVLLCTNYKFWTIYIGAIILLI